MSDAANARSVEEVDMQAYSLQAQGPSLQAPGAMLGSNDPSCIARKILRKLLAGD